MGQDDAQFFRVPVGKVGGQNDARANCDRRGNAGAGAQRKACRQARDQAFAGNKDGLCIKPQAYRQAEPVKQADQQEGANHEIQETRPSCDGECRVAGGLVGCVRHSPKGERCIRRKKRSGIGQAGGRMVGARRRKAVKAGYKPRLFFCRHRLRRGNWRWGRRRFRLQIRRLCPGILGHTDGSPARR